MAGVGIPQYETVTEFPYGNYRFRVWREESEYKIGPDMSLISAVKQLYYSVMSDSELDKQVKELLNKIGSLPRVVKIEVLDTERNGCAFYQNGR